MCFRDAASFSSAAALALCVTLFGGCSERKPAAPSTPNGMHHSFTGAQEWAARFENPERDAWQKPEEVLAFLGLHADDRVADIGAGTGYFPVRFARVVTRGVVYAIDLEPDMVHYLADRARRENLPNLRAVQCVADDPQIPEPVDLIFMCDTYHHIDERSAYFHRLRADLRPGGRVVIVDFFKRTAPVGPPPEHKISKEQVSQEMVQAGYRVVRQLDLPYQYVLMFTPAETDD